jgi:hypothetical protein
MADPGAQRVRLRAREGEDVEWTHRVAQRASTLKDMMDDAPTEDGVYPLPTIAAAELEMLREMCEADSMPARLEQCSIPELFRLVEGASFLDAPGALNHAQRALASRLEGKRADELRELLGATDDFGSVEDRLAALAEPAFSPEGQLSLATTGSAGPPALDPQPSLSGVEVTDDAKEAALGMVDVGTLAELKGVSRSWLVLARRVLCSRLSRCEGQPVPTQMAEITDLNIKILVDAGRPWEAAAAGRLLPSLDRLRWEGIEVSVGMVRELYLAEERPYERTFLGGPTKAALLSCIEGEGEPPLQLLLAAVACAGYGKVHGIPVQMMRHDSVSELYLARRDIGVEGGMLLAYLVPVMSGLTSINLSGNQLCGILTDRRGDQRGTYTAEGITAIADALRVNGALTSIDLSENILTNYGRDMTGIKQLAAALGVNGGLTVANLLGNQLNAESAKMLAEVAKQKGISLCGIQRDQTTADFRNKGLKLSDTILLASDLSQAVVTGALTSIKLRANNLRDEGWGAIFAAICGNKDSKIMSLDASSETIGTAGVKLIAEALRTSVTGSLTSIDLYRNQLCGLNWEGKGIYSAEGVAAIADALRVNGGLTSLNLCYNQLCGLDDHGRGTYTAVGITAIADALRVNGALTKIE